MARGDFSATALGRVEARLNSIFKGERYNKQTNAPYDAVKALLERQTASFDPIMVNKECRGAKVTFLKDCDEAVLNTTDNAITDCVITGKRVESVSVNYDINDDIYDGITVYDDECDNNQIKREEKVAFGLAKLFSKFRGAVEAKGIAFLDANATDFGAGPVDYGTIGADTTELEWAAAEWTSSIIGELTWMADQHGVENPFIIDGGNLWLEDWMNKYKTNGCCVIDSLGGNGPIDLVYGTKTVRNTTGKSSAFLIDPDSYAFWTKNFYQNTAPLWMQDAQNTYVWKMPVPGLFYSNGGSITPVYADIERQRQCEVSGSVMRWKTVWRAKLNFAFVLGPDICATGETGIIHAVQT